MRFCEECGTGAKDCCCGALTPAMTLRRIVAQNPEDFADGYATEARRMDGLKRLAKREAGE